MRRNLLSLIGYFILEVIGDGIFAQLLAGIGGLSIMTAVAYYRSWSKQIEKSVHAHPGRPAVEEPGVPISEPVEQGNRTVAVAV